MNLLLTISYFVHLLATIAWLGGMAFLTLLVVPALQRLAANRDENRQLLLNLQKRFRPVANFSLVLLLGTGMIQMSADPNYKGFLAIENTWSVAMLLKHLAFGGMILILMFVQFGLIPRLEREHLLASRGQPNELDMLLRREARLTIFQLLLGVVVLIFTAVATAI